MKSTQEMEMLESGKVRLYIPSVVPEVSTQPLVSLSSDSNSVLTDCSRSRYVVAGSRF